jgi:hypothetical protein
MAEIPNIAVKTILPTGKTKLLADIFSRTVSLYLLNTQILKILCL